MNLGATAAPLKKLENLGFSMSCGISASSRDTPSMVPPTVPRQAFQTEPVKRGPTCAPQWCPTQQPYPLDKLTMRSNALAEWRLERNRHPPATWPATSTCRTVRGYGRTIRQERSASIRPEHVDPRSGPDRIQPPTGCQAPVDRQKADRRSEALATLVAVRFRRLNANRLVCAGARPVPSRRPAGCARSLPFGLPSCTARAGQ